MNGTDMVTAIVDILVAGITRMGTGIATGVNSFAQALAITGTGENAQLSQYFIIVLAFAGVSVAIALTTKIFLWLSSLGN